MRFTGSFEFERARVSFCDGDTIASALFRAGVRTFSRSFKYHRRRGLHCLSGDCPNCLMRVDEEPCVRACMTAADGVRRVSRENGWPSVERDLLAVADRMHGLLPVGFYYKIGLRPRWLWPRLEPLIRRVAGRGDIDMTSAPVDRERRTLRPDLLVIGGGVAGLAAALAGAEADMSVVLCDEGRLGERVASGRARSRIDALADEIRGRTRVIVLERAPAIGIYEGPLVPVNTAGVLHVLEPQRIVVATGAVEAHDVFPGSDLPGVWLARAAAQMAGVHGIVPGRRAVVVGAHQELDDHVETLRAAGVETLELGDVRVERASGRGSVRQVTVKDGRVLECDALVLARGFSPRDSLLRQGEGLPVAGAGQVLRADYSLELAEESGRRAALGEGDVAIAQALPEPASAGFVCLCEDVEVKDLERAWSEGFQTTEILKRYTTATMGPCRGALCQGHLRSFVVARSAIDSPVAAATTARAPTRDITVEEAASGERAELHQQTALHDRHFALGETMEPAGAWRRPERYEDVDAEYWAVRRHVSIMDVGTLGKFLVGGPGAEEFLERVYPCRVGDLEPGRIRYALLLGQHGYVVDDGLICALEDGRYYLTFTSGGAEQAEAHLRDWIETWSLEVHLVNRTAALGAINVAGPRARDVLTRLCSDPLDRESFPYLQHREIVVAGVPCRAVRLGFVGELSYELHHASSRSVELWDALSEAGIDLGIRPHGLEALRLLRLEKGHVLIGQDTDYDSTPMKLGMDWAVKLDKPYFVGRTALERIGAFQVERRLLALRFEDETPAEGTPLFVDGELIGHLTSSRFSPVLGYGIGLGWASRVTGEFPTAVDANGSRGLVVAGSFYDPEGARLRA